MNWRRIGLVMLCATIGVSALLLLAKSAQNSSEFSRLQLWILLLNVIGVIALTALLARKLWQLVREYRNHVPGSRLTAAHGTGSHASPRISVPGKRVRSASSASRLQFA